MDFHLTNPGSVHIVAPMAWGGYTAAVFQKKIPLHNVCSQV